MLKHAIQEIGKTGPPVFALLLSCASAACDRPAQPANDAAPASPPVSPAPSSVDSTARYFDPGALQIGDTVLGMRVRSLAVNRAFNDSLWVGTVVFQGAVEVSGVYQAHFDYPEVQSLCFHADSISSLHLPEFAHDSMSSPNAKPWFCFTNPDSARHWLGSPDTARHATIVIDDFTQHRYFTDAFDTARLVRVLSRGEAGTARTLREPGRFPQKRDPVR